MAKKRAASPGEGRQLRADARRNRERILEAAKLVFRRDGAEASLDEIARQAGVGPGTLYRHFPTREDLIIGVYQDAVEKLAAAEGRLADSMPPLDALRAWMLLLIEHVSHKTLILPAMETVPGGSARLIEGSKNLVHGAFLRSMQRAVESGDLRADVDPDDIFRAMIGVFHTSAIPGWEQSARRLVDILLAGARAEARL